MPDQVHRHAAIMFTDIVGYTALMGSDEDKAFELLEKNRQLHTPLISQYKGTLIKEIGDGMLIGFELASDAVRCAIRIQEDAKEKNISLRIGIHEGEMVFAGEDVLGDGVNIASRLQEGASEGCIHISSTVYKSVKNKSDIHTEFLGEKTFKNVDEPVKVYEVSSADGKKDIGSGGAKSKQPHYRLAAIVLGVVVVALAGIVGWWYYSSRMPSTSEEQYSLGDSRIAILPYENNTNDPNLDMLGDMAADWIIQGLMSLDNIKVVNFQTTKDNVQFASIGSLGTFAERTGAHKYIKGSYYLQGDMVIFHSQLIDVSTGEFELALPEIRGNKNNIEAIVEEMRDRLMTVFAARNDPDYEIIRQRAPKYKAYEYSVNGSEAFGKDYDESRKMMNKAIALDSSYYTPYIWNVASYLNQGSQHKADSVFKLVEGFTDGLPTYDRLWIYFTRAMVSGDINRMYEASSKIFQKDPLQFLPNYHTGLYASRLNRPNEAIQTFSHLNPANLSYSVALHIWWNVNYAYCLIRLGRYNEAINILGYVPLDVTTTSYFNTLLTAYVLNGDDDMLAPTLRKMEDQRYSWEDITYAQISITKAYLLTAQKEKHKEWAMKLVERVEDIKKEAGSILKADVYYLAGDYQEAVDQYKTADILEPLTWWSQSRMGGAFARLGMNEEAEKIIASLQDNINEENEGSHKYGLAIIYSALGDKATATDFLKEAFDAGFSFWDIDRHDLDTDLIPLYDYPPFQEFVKPKG